MENKPPLTRPTTKGDFDEKLITAFSAVKQDYGLQIKVSGCVTLRPAQSRSENVIGIVELDDQIVPILDSRQNRSGGVSDLSCIVLFEHTVGQTTIVTGRLYESACQVFDLIVECMDNPDAHEDFYTKPKRIISTGAGVKNKQTVAQ